MIKHCIYCGLTFDTRDEMLQHIKENHAVIGSG